MSVMLIIEHNSEQEGKERDEVKNPTQEVNSSFRPPIFMRQNLCEFDEKEKVKTQIIKK
jgi:hypothetical protein